MGADAAGNMTYRETVAGGNRLTYKHDRWGRLTEVWFSNGAPSGTPNRAVYRYNGLSMRCLVERDSNAADLSNTLNERRALYYGAGWQVLEERVDADKDADYDRLAQNVWGLRYIDDLVLRRANANWNAGADTDFADAGDTDWEQFLNDHQFSVVAGVNRVGTLTFRLAYDAYGEARHSWAKDIDGDGDVDATDWTLARDASGNQIHQSGYNADADWNRDGTVNSTDTAAFGSAYYATALAGGLVASSASDLNVGFCGYRFNAELGAYTVRFRHYDPTPGVARWLERDPAGYADGPSLYEYAQSQPSDGSDPSGLWRDEGMGGYGAERAINRSYDVHGYSGEGYWKNLRRGYEFLDEDANSRGRVGRIQLHATKVAVAIGLVYLSGSAILPALGISTTAAAGTQMLWGGTVWSTLDLAYVATNWDSFSVEQKDEIIGTYLGAALMGGVIYAPGKTPWLRPGSTERGVVIGRFMKDRVIPYAEANGLGWYEETAEVAMLSSRARLRANRQWIRKMIEEGFYIYDIGSPSGAGAVRPSPYYDMEMKFLRRTGYCKYNRVYGVP